MDLKEIIKILMLSELYFSLPLEERKEVVHRLYAQYGQGALPCSSSWAETPPALSRNQDDD